MTVTLPPSVSGGALAVIETENAPGHGPPLHRHPEAETFRILEGRYLFDVNGVRTHASAGDLVHVPGGAAHTFMNATDRPARQLVVITPGLDAERFFRELAVALAAVPPEPAALAAFASAWRVDFLGPPLRLDAPP
jgi:quercetin dioxygenase-like cupin family protein